MAASLTTWRRVGYGRSPSRYCLPRPCRQPGSAPRKAVAGHPGASAPKVAGAMAMAHVATGVVEAAT